jgi:hypothetical protein
MAAFCERVATEKAGKREAAAVKQPMTDERFVCIFRTAGHKAAMAAEQRAYEPLI